MKDEGIYCTIGGHSALDIAREVCENALTTLAVGSCASWGGVASANPNPTGCVGVKEAVPNATVVNLPGCPVNVENITATIVHFLTFGSLPARDARLRPLFGSVESAMNAAVLLNWKKPMSSHVRFAPLFF
jgi:hydrogenase small subunit